MTDAERRAQNELREQIGELRGKLQAYEEMGLKPKPAEVPRGAITNGKFSGERPEGAGCAATGSHAAPPRRTTMTDPVICHLCGKTIDEDEISMSKIWPVRAHGWCSRVWIEHELAQIDANKLKEIRAHKAAPLVPTKTEELNKTEPDKEERPSRDEISMSKHAERRAQNELREQIGELKFSAEAYEEEEKQTQESQLNSLREEIAAAEERAANKLKEIRAHKAAMQPQETQG